MMFPKGAWEEDVYFRKEWIKDQPEWACLLTGDPSADFCHLRSKGAGGSDYLGFPLRNELHIQLDHGPRGREVSTLKHGQFRYELSQWMMRLPLLHMRYVLHMRKTWGATVAQTLLRADTLRGSQEICRDIFHMMGDFT